MVPRAGQVARLRPCEMGWRGMHGEHGAGGRAGRHGTRGERFGCCVYPRGVFRTRRGAEGITRLWQAAVGCLSCSSSRRGEHFERSILPKRRFGHGGVAEGSVSGMGRCRGEQFDHSRRPRGAERTLCASEGSETYVKRLNNVRFPPLEHLACTFRSPRASCAYVSLPSAGQLGRATR